MYLDKILADFEEKMLHKYWTQSTNNGHSVCKEQNKVIKKFLLKAVSSPMRVTLAGICASTRGTRR